MQLQFEIVSKDDLPDTLRREGDTGDAMIGVAEIAELAGVTSAAVANWRRRKTNEFPSPAHDSRSGPLYRRAKIEEWLATKRPRRGRPPKNKRPAAKSSGKTKAASPPAQPLGVEASLWAAADKLRGSVDASQYRTLVLTLLFLRRVLDSQSEPTGLEVPSGLTWDTVTEAPPSEMAASLGKAVEAIEGENPRLAGVIPNAFTTSGVDARRLSGLVNIVSQIPVDEAHRDQLGRVYEYFLGRFASLEGRSGGEFYTPSSVVRLLVEMIEPLSGKVYDPCCGSGGMFVQSARFLEAHGGQTGDLSIFGQELNPNTWKLALMNLALHNLEGYLGEGPADTFHGDVHPNLKADYVLANPPFNISDWGADSLLKDPRWTYGVPPAGNANLAWVQHILARLSDTGRAGVVLANGSLSSDQTADVEVRSELVRQDVIECMVALPTQLFYSTTIPVTLWFLSKDKGDRAGSTLFINARDLGKKVTRTHRVLLEEDVDRIAQCYRRWRDGEAEVEEPGFSAVVTTADIEAARMSLVPSRYVGFGDLDDEDVEPLEDLVVRYRTLRGEVDSLDRKILDALSPLLS